MRKLSSVGKPFKHVLKADLESDEAEKPYVLLRGLTSRENMRLTEEALTEGVDPSNSQALGMFMTRRYIDIGFVGWGGFSDKDGNALEFSEENKGRFEEHELMEIAEEVFKATEMTDADAKNS